MPLLRKRCQSHLIDQMYVVNYNGSVNWILFNHFNYRVLQTTEFKGIHKCYVASNVAILLFVYCLLLFFQELRFQQKGSHAGYASFDVVIIPIVTDSNSRYFHAFLQPLS